VVLSCETCTRSYARCDNFDDEVDEDGESVLRYSADEDATVEGWVVFDDEVDEDGGKFLAYTSVLRYSTDEDALRSTPSTILEPVGWLA
jgi:hypothetical protein